jgi:predicted transcriptional regulator
MPTASIRIDEHALATLRELANKQRQSLQTVLKEAIDSYRRQKFLEEANAAFAALHDDPESWREEEEEREIWDRAIKDGLEQRE